MQDSFENRYLLFPKPRYSPSLESILNPRYGIAENIKFGNQIKNQNQFSDHSTFIEKITERLKIMMQHVSKTVTRLLQNLNYLYQTNGINYEVSQFHYTLMRLLTPYQLLSHFHIKDNYQLFKGDQAEKQKLMQCLYKQKYDLLDFDKFRQNQKSLKQKKRQQRLQKLQKLQKLSLKSGQLKSTDSILQNNLFLNKKSTNQKLNSGKTMLGQDVQKQLANWVLQELAMNKRVLKMKDIAQKTKMISHKYKNFKCSIGWVNRFLYRYPYLKIMMKLAKDKNYQKIMQIYFKVKRILQKDIEEQVKTFNQQLIGHYNYTQNIESQQNIQQEKQSQYSQQNINQNSDISDPENNQFHFQVQTKKQQLQSQTQQRGYKRITPKDSQLNKNTYLNLKQIRGQIYQQNTKNQTKRQQDNKLISKIMKKNQR